MYTIMQRWQCSTLIVLAFIVNSVLGWEAEPQGSAVSTWKLGTPIVTYFGSHPMTDTVARQMAEGGFNLVWCTEEELDVVQRHGLRAQLVDPLLSPVSLDNPVRREKLDALIARVRNHPALYSYLLRDEPSAADFPGLGKLVTFLRERDPKHLMYINLFPTCATNEQLGTKGDTVSAYKEYLRQYFDIVNPTLLSYDHYHFAVAGDCSFGNKTKNQYFLNLAMIQQAAEEAEMPFLNIVQACSWRPSMRVPNGDEMRFLVYTTLAYGAQGISYYVYCRPGKTGGIALPDGTPTLIYDVLKSLNREFVAIATELQPLNSLGVYHCGMTPPGTKPLPNDTSFRLDPPEPIMPYEKLKPIKGMLLGYFGPAQEGDAPGKPTHALVVNLDYAHGKATTVVGLGDLEVFQPATRTWSPTNANRAELDLSPGGGKLVRQIHKAVRP